MFEFEISSRLENTQARTGEFITPYHRLETPELAIVATEAEFKAVPRDLWNELPCNYLIVNTFHIDKKREEREVQLLDEIDAKGSVHEHMGLTDRTIASDSGGFQVFSLGFGKSHHVGKIGGMFPGMDAQGADTDNPLTISDEGVSFPFDGRNVTLTPELSMEIQHKIGADVMFAFDECTSPLNSKEYTEEALQRTHRWLDQCIDAHKGYEAEQALFAIVQGGAYQDLRIKAAEVLAEKNVPGYGIGGSLGKTKQDMYDILEWVIPSLPEEKPRHLLGIGTIRDIFEGVERGVDLFDCVIPTREGRHGRLYTENGWVALRKAKNLNEVIDPQCECFGCRDGITYSQLWELYQQRDPRFPLFATGHNIWFFSKLMTEIRESIDKNSFYELKQEYLQRY